MNIELETLFKNLAISINIAEQTLNWYKIADCNAILLKIKSKI